MQKLSENQTRLLREYVRAKRQYVWAVAFKKDHRDEVLQIIEQLGGTHEIDEGVLYAGDSISINKLGARTIYRVVKFHDKRI